MIIKKVQAHEIINGQGLPTLQCTIKLANNHVVQSAIPAPYYQVDGTAHYAYDSNERLLGKGMLNAAKYINTTIAPLLIDQPLNALAMDSQLMDLDTTQTKQNIGANATLAVSYALFKAQAASENIQLYEFLQSISGTKQIAMPQPIISIIQTKHAIKELLLLPQQESVTENIDAAVSLYHHMHKSLTLKKMPVHSGAHGSFILDNSTEEIMNMLQEIFKTLPQYTYQVGLSIASSQLYDTATKTYHWNNQTLLSNDFIKEYSQLLDRYSYISYLQDPLAPTDKTGWKSITTELDQTTIAGDAVFTSNSMKIRKGIIDNVATHTVIKPEHIGTVSQAIAAIDACKNNKKPFIIAADQGQTCDSFPVDLAVGTGAFGLKAGGVHRSEFTSKYNRLIEIKQNMLQN